MLTGSLIISPIQRRHFILDAFATSSSSEPVLSAEDLSPFGPASGTQTAASASVGAAISIPWSPGNDPTDLPMSDEENPSFGNNPNAPDLTEC